MAATALDTRLTETAEPPRSAVKTGTHSPAVVELLKQPAAYPDRPQGVSLIETHISWVFVTDRFVYKLKKPVRFDFVDFSTPDARRRACLAERELNGRMARGVYLAVLPITADARGRLTLGGKGQAIDWVVKMRRLPADRMLDHLLRAGQLPEADAERLATWLANYYDRLSPVCMDAWRYRQAIERHVLGNCAELLDPKHSLPTDLVKRCHAAQMRFLALSCAQLDDRVCDGRIVDGHGDLRPEHICLATEPVVFDCLEFSDELRRVDVADELAFLAMECDGLDAEHLGRQVLETYQQVSGDRVSPALWTFYKCYRACVRAKVAALTAQPADASFNENARRRALDYLVLADRYARELGPPSLIVVGGLMGTGKTTLATALAKRLGSDWISTDVIRRELLGASPSPAALNEGHYSPQLRRRVYREMFRRAGILLRQCVSVVLDGTFLKAAKRDAAQKLADASGAVSLLVHCTCARETALERIARREAAGGALSEARADLYDLQSAAQEPYDQSASVVDVDTTAAVAMQEFEVLAQVRRRLETGSGSLPCGITKNVQRRRSRTELAGLHRPRGLRHLREEWQAATRAGRLRPPPRKS